MIKLYCDLMSQPSRAIYILLKTVNCNFEKKLVDLRKAEHYSDELTKLNRFQKVPFIDHNGFILTESVAIIKYLSRENIIPDSLFPKESKAAARVDEYLEWQHIDMRLHCAMYFRVKYLDPILFKREADPKQIAGYESRLEQALEIFSSKWLGQGHQFIVGDQVTVADLMAAVELEQPRMAGYDPMEKYAVIGEWMKKVRAFYNPHYDEAHVVLNKVVRKYHATMDSKL